MKFIGLRDKAWICYIQASQVQIQEHIIIIKTHNFEDLKVSLLTGHAIFNNMRLMKLIRAITKAGKCKYPYVLVREHKPSYLTVLDESTPLSTVAVNNSIYYTSRILTETIEEK